MEQDSTFYHARALERGLSLLEAVGAAAAPLGLGQLLADTRIPKSSLVRLLSVLERGEYVVRASPEPRYVLGPMILRLADIERGTLNAEVLARPHLVRLAADSGQTSNLGVLHGTMVLHVCVEEPNRPLRFRSASGSVDEAYCTGLGKVLLAGLPDTDLDRHLPSEPLTRHTDRSPSTRAELLERLAEVRELGYAVDDQERDLGVRCLAIALELPYGVRAAISVAGPAGELEPTTRGTFLDQLRSVAATLRADYAFCAAMVALGNQTQGPA